MKVKLYNPVLKIGGSILSKEQNCNNGFFQFAFAKKLAVFITDHLPKATCIIGGGYLNTWLLNELNKNIQDVSAKNKHYIGIRAINVNAEFFKSVLSPVVQNKNKKLYEKVVLYATSELSKIVQTYDYIVGGAKEPGTSSDFNALLTAEYLNSKTIISFKNIDGVYSADPRKDTSATRLEHVTWDKYLNIIKATEHKPRANYPVDPISAKRAREKGIRFIIVDGENLDNLQKLFSGQDFIGTIIENI